jgi:hypothetical protein
MAEGGFINCEHNGIKENRPGKGRPTGLPECDDKFPHTSIHDKKKIQLNSSSGLNRTVLYV